MFGESEIFFKEYFYLRPSWILFGRVASMYFVTNAWSSFVPDPLTEKLHV